MKSAVSMFSFTENANLHECFSLIQRAGYQGVEPVLSESGYLNQNTTEKEILAIKRLSED